MVCCAALGLVLLVLLLPAMGAEVDNLKNIINYLKTHYGRSGNQYALGINVPDNYCHKDAKLDVNFLLNDKDNNVKNGMNSADRVYNGNQLIGAKPKEIPGKNANYHSEYLLLINSKPDDRCHQNDNLMGSLLNKTPQGCAVFFTLNSPCVTTCSTPKDDNHPYSIIPGLKAFQNHGGPKAFVFHQVWEHDVNKADWEINIRAIDKILPVYRCDGKGCVRCVNSNTVNNRCKNNSG